MNSGINITLLIMKAEEVLTKFRNKKAQRNFDGSLRLLQNNNLKDVSFYEIFYHRMASLSINNNEGGI